MEKRLEALRLEIEQTRERLLQKISSLEEHARADISQGLFDVVRNTATTIGSQFDVRRQMARHPLFFAGASAALAYWLFGRRSHHSQAPAHEFPAIHDSTTSSAGTSSENPQPMLAAHAPITGTPTLWDQLGQITLSTLASVVPPLSARVIPPLVDGLIEKMGKEHGQNPEGLHTSGNSPREASAPGNDEISRKTYTPDSRSAAKGSVDGNFIRPT